MSPRQAEVQPPLIANGFKNGDSIPCPEVITPEVVFAAFGNIACRPA